MGGGRGGGVWGDGRRRKEKGKLLSKETRWALEKVNEFLPPLRRSLSLLSLPLSSCLVLQPIFRKPSTSLCPARSLSPRPSRFSTFPILFLFPFTRFFRPSRRRVLQSRVLRRRDLDIVLLPKTSPPRPRVPTPLTRCPACTSPGAGRRRPPPGRALRPPRPSAPGPRRPGRSRWWTPGPRPRRPKARRSGARAARKPWGRGAPAQRAAPGRPRRAPPGGGWARSPPRGGGRARGPRPRRRRGGRGSRRLFFFFFGGSGGGFFKSSRAMRARER